MTSHEVDSPVLYELFAISEWDGGSGVWQETGTLERNMPDWLKRACDDYYEHGQFNDAGYPSDDAGRNLCKEFEGYTLASGSVKFNVALAELRTGATVSTGNGGLEATWCGKEGSGSFFITRSGYRYIKGPYDYYRDVAGGFEADFGDFVLKQGYFYPIENYNHPY
ncbi:MAG: hypothetical protein WC889_15770 [Myxococcota bacterium]|jgi:hypothetical protein